MYQKQQKVFLTPFSGVLNEQEQLKTVNKEDFSNKKISSSKTFCLW
jgi:hypothetical protein